MNKTITISLAGINFYIDEVAYVKLDHYLKAITASLHEESRAETMQDIEGRIAELFLENGKEKTKVIDEKDVDAVISVLGQPKDFQTEEETEETNEATYSYKGAKKLYRDIDHRTIGGVCSGLAHYTGIDTIWVRLIFLVLFLPFLFIPLITFKVPVLIIYIILWIIMPAARTTSEKLEMQGEKINIDNIERKVREEFSNIKKKGTVNTSGTDRFFQALGDLLAGFFTFLAKVLGVLLVIFGCVGILAILFSFITVNAFTISGASWIDYITIADIGVPFWVANLLILLFIGIPLFALLWLGLKLLVSRLRSMGSTVIIVLIALWVISLFALGALGIRQATIRAFEGKISQVNAIPISTKDTLHIVANTNRHFDYFSIKTAPNGRQAMYFKNLTIHPFSTTQNARVEIIKSAQGESNQNAVNTAKRIQYSYNINGDSLLLNTYFYTAFANKFKDQQIDVNVYIPEGMVFTVDRPITYKMWHIPSNYANKALIFKDGKIECLDCSTAPDEPAQKDSAETSKTSQ